MNPETFFDNFGMLADVPDGVSKLRGLILQLAVQGKLVPQDEGDEPCQIIKSASIENNEAPFELPKVWAWVKLDYIILKAFTGLVKPRQHQSPDFNYAYFKMNNISVNGNCNLSDITRIEATDAEVKKYVLDDGDFLFNTRNSYELVGKSCIFKNELGEICLFNNNILKITFVSEISSNFMNMWFISPAGKALLNNLKSSTTNVAAIYQGKLRNFLAPVPPLAEQRRIVIKVNQLMTLCDELEARQQKKQEARLRLNSAALDKLLTAHEPAEFANHWQRVCDNFDLLYDNLETVGELRKVILQLAVQGKLVRQDENDEPAAVLLGKIKAEKEQLVQEKRIKRTKENGEILKDEYVTTFPKNWVLSKIVDLGFVTKLAGFEYTKHIELKDYGEVPVIRAQNVRMNYIDERNLKYIDMNTSNLLDRCALAKKAILMTFIGAGIGDVAIFDKNERWHLAPNVAKIELFNEYEEKIDIKYFLYYLMSAPGRDEIFKFSKATAQPSLSMGTIRQVVVALPPLNEQHRIVARVDTLMTLCDDLEAKLKQSQTDGAKLMEAVVHKLVAA